MQIRFSLALQHSDDAAKTQIEVGMLSCGCTRFTKGSVLFWVAVVQWAIWGVGQRGFFICRLQRRSTILPSSDLVLTGPWHILSSQLKYMHFGIIIVSRNLRHLISFVQVITLFTPETLSNLSHDHHDVHGVESIRRLCLSKASLILRS